MLSVIPPSLTIPRAFRSLAQCRFVLGCSETYYRLRTFRRRQCGTKPILHCLVLNTFVELVYCVLWYLLACFVCLFSCFNESETICLGPFPAEETLSSKALSSVVKVGCCGIVVSCTKTKNRFVHLFSYHKHYARQISCLCVCVCVYKCDPDYMDFECPFLYI